MDDFGNLLWTEEWLLSCEQQSYSTSTFGWLEDDFLPCAYWIQEI